MRLVALLLLLTFQNVRVADLEEKIVTRVNLERSARGQRPLKRDEALSSTARAYSRDMAQRGFFSHTNPEGEDARQRLKAAHYNCKKMGENLFSTYLYSSVRIRGTQKSYDWKSEEQIATDAVRRWMNSAGHRRNILDGEFDRTGIGVAIASNSRVYMTELFCE